MPRRRFESRPRKPIVCVDELRRELRGDAGDDSISSVCVSAVRRIDGSAVSPTKEFSDGEAIGEYSGDASDRGDAKGKSESIVWVEVCWDFTGGKDILSRLLSDTERPYSSLGDKGSEWDSST